MDISISEKRLEGFIYDHLTGKVPLEKFEETIGGQVYGCVFRQFPLGAYGVADIVVIEHEQANPEITIYELKQGEINTSALLQVLRYKKGILEYAEQNSLRIYMDTITCVLIGSEISHTDSFCVSLSAVDSVYAYTYDLCPISGLFFHDENSWAKTDPNFPKRLKKAFVGVEYAAADRGALYYKNNPVGENDEPF